VTLRASGGASRTVAAADLATGPGRTLARPGELLSQRNDAAPAGGSSSSSLRREFRRAMEIAVVGAAALVTVADGTIHDARIALTAVAPTIVRATEAEAVPRGA